MRLIFLGDVSVEKAQHSLGSAESFPIADLVLANLEGPIASDAEVRASKPRGGPLVYNSPDALEVLRAFNVRAVYLANNHMYDLPLPASHTRRRLATAGIAAFGAGPNLRKAARPWTFIGPDGSRAIFVAFGWDVIGCRPATHATEGVNPLRPDHVLRIASEIRQADRDSFLTFVMHWNYELESYPQPAHRQLAHELIRQGVDAVIGLHPHVVQGAEIVDGKLVAYSLGNWFFPPRQAGVLHLSFPPSTYRQLALELEVKGRELREPRFRWYRFDPACTSISLEAVEGVGGDILRNLTPFAGMDHSEYRSWFKANRRRRKALPVYLDYRDRRRNFLRDRFVRLRQSLIQVLVRLRLKRGPRD